MTTPNLQLAEVPEAIREASDEINDSFWSLDAIVQLSVKDKDLTEAPESVVQGDRYIVAEGALGTWYAKDRSIAYMSPTGWLYFRPRKGWKAYVEDEESTYVYNGTEWVSDGGGSSGASEDPLAVYEHFTDMDFSDPGNSGSYYNRVVSNGAVDQTGAEIGRPGVIRIQKNSNSTAQANFFWDAAPIFVNGGEITFECDVKISVAQAATSGDNGAHLNIGLRDALNNTGDSSNFIGFRCRAPVGTHWYGSTIRGSNETVVNSSFVHVANTWFRLKFVVNATGTEVEFFINGASIGKSSTNIPTDTTALRWRWQVWQASSFANGIMAMYVDWVRVRKVLTNPR